MNSRFPFTSFPTGWFCVAHSHELRPAQVKPLRYFGKDLVLFRTKEGVARVFDAHCPHLGAHLGYGGKVKGETIQCPFHGWCFDGSGQCSDIPYASKIPPKAQMRTWPVREVNGLIMVYYHPQGEPPTWEIPEIPEYASKEWTAFRSVGRWKLRTHVQETTEQAADAPHFRVVHSMEDAKIESMEAENHILNVTLDLKAKCYVSLYGLGYNLQHFSDISSKSGAALIALILSTPIDENYINFEIIISLKKLFIPGLTSAIMAATLAVFRKEVKTDLLVLGKKAYLANPSLTEGEGAISQYRRWARQFLVSEDAATKITLQSRL